MNNNKKEITVIVKKPTKRPGELPPFPERRRPVINSPIINPFVIWNDDLASTKEGAFLQGYMRGLTYSRRHFAKERKKANEIASPAENLLGDWKEELAETLKEHFVLGFLQGLITINK